MNTMAVKQWEWSMFVFILILHMQKNKKQIANPNKLLDTNTRYMSKTHFAK